MIPLHAPDAMGKAANAAALTASRIDFHLFAAASANCTREQRSVSLRQAFLQWHQLCRAMSALEQAAPTAKAEGYVEAERLADMAEKARVA